MTTTYTTNREYRTDGTKQIIEIEYIPFEGGDWDDDACDLVAVHMNDLARGIHQMVRVLRFACTPDQIGAAVLASYDNNLLAPWNAKVGDLVIAQ
jgi:hypothetical protein